MNIHLNVRMLKLFEINKPSIIFRLQRFGMPLKANTMFEIIEFFIQIPKYNELFQSH